MPETAFLAKEAIMDELELDENEFDDIYIDLLGLIRTFGTIRCRAHVQILGAGTNYWP